MNQAILQKIINARKILVLDYPFWGNLALRLTLREDPTCKSGWTDGETLGYNPEWINTLTNAKTVGWCAHEVCHPMYQHHTRRMGRNKSLWNRAGDYVINGILKQENFDLPEDPLLDSRFDGMNTDDVFKILETEREEARQKFRELQKKKREGGEDGEENKNEGGEGGEGNKSRENGKGEKDGEGSEDGEDEKDGEKSKDGDENKDEDKNEDADGSGDDSMDDEQDDDEDEDSGSSSDNGDDDEEDSGEDLDEDEDNDENPVGPFDKLDPDFFDNDPDPGDCGEVRDYPGQDNEATPAELRQEEQEQKIATVQAANQAKRMGNMPMGLDREIKELVEPKIDPRDLLQRFVAMSAKNDFAWTPPSRKYICQGLYLPSLKSEELGTVVLVLDTSISIHQKELDQFSSIVSAILEAYIIDVIVLYCDTEVYEPEYFKKEDLPLKLKIKGGGGTDFKNAFTWVTNNDILPTCLIYLTDLECDSYPEHEPDYPVIWVSTVPEEKLWYGKPPWGEIVYIDLEKD